jgi:hypothetical protein
MKVKKLKIKIVATILNGTIFNDDSHAMQMKLHKIWLVKQPVAVWTVVENRFV